jgi:hypothetical protein
MQAQPITTPMLFGHLNTSDQAEAITERGVHLFDWPIGAYFVRFFAVDGYFVLVRLDVETDEVLVRAFPGHGPLFDAMLQAMEDLGLAQVD